MLLLCYIILSVPKLLMIFSVSHDHVTCVMSHHTPSPKSKIKRIKIKSKNKINKNKNKNKNQRKRK